MIKDIYRYIALFLYSFFSSVLMLLVLGFAISSFYYFKEGSFNFPASQVKRAIVFGCVAGSAITLYVLVVNVINKFSTKKSPPEDPK
ncbi:MULTISPECIES: hypothetical protein [unclassified Serratia (in: enterobacteria)]|uniref:hypothetical protein n=1 Tax=unclassified Serratia (in: enterobacteria) TaxID=2647522 RepID=UPI000504F1FF|nr:MULTISPECIES: hypothetical protein [unclassified Serratia (in: enterobacteria)]KFK93714.1 hypothetical protein JV45_15000 [Serratia sp. Ag2]KFK98920.1 hypothetical protein IV04_09870 [Serratia sp. Ag1]